MAFPRLVRWVCVLDVPLVCDCVEENWPSMDLVAKMLFQHNHRADVAVQRRCPPMRMRPERIPFLKPTFRNLDRLLNASPTIRVAPESCKWVRLFQRYQP
jgi:hypothetical protein